nr:immunoglobulin light chain junction region [Mus musculus]NSL97127.1 immunoglobulin light chain junction region [Mus musculus]NSL97299.1 immunoglobulin light chain junction region [Mus musculus]NSL97496.1 immunoglobulin light chain junction region [Mus musculus]NSL97568.1 immunoglobulin light chain junction region [Mus musculus]
CQQWSSNPPTF